jgi:hypothetical protein
VGDLLAGMDVSGVRRTSVRLGVPPTAFEG